MWLWLPDNPGQGLRLRLCPRGTLPSHRVKAGSPLFRLKAANHNALFGFLFCQLLWLMSP